MKALSSIEYRDCYTRYVATYQARKVLVSLLNIMKKSSEFVLLGLWYENFIKNNYRCNNGSRERANSHRRERNRVEYDLLAKYVQFMKKRFTGAGDSARQLA